MKRIVSISLVLCMYLPLLVGCSKQETAVKEQNAAGKVCIVLNDSKDNRGWSQAGYDAAMKLQADGVEVLFSESVPVADAGRIMREYAEDGCNLIIGHSFGYRDIVFQVAEEYPDINFSWSGGTHETAENVADMDAPFYQASYLLGIIAANMTQTKKLGSVMPFEVPALHAMTESFLQGAQSVDKEITIIGTTTGVSDDIAKEKEAALSLLDMGADFILPAGGCFGIIEAVKEKGGYTAGYMYDVSDLAPDNIPASIIWDLYPIYRDMLDKTLDGSFNNEFYDWGVEKDVINLEYSNTVQIPEAAKQQVEDVLQKVKSGEFEIPFIPN